MTNLRSFHSRAPLAAAVSLLFALGCASEPSDVDLESISSALDTSYPAKVANCTNCTNAGTYVDLNNGAVLKFLNVSGGAGGTATLRFSMSSPSGVRKMGVFVNNTKVGTVSTTTVRPTFADASLTASLPAGTANTIELRDTEGAAEPDVASLKVTTGGGGGGGGGGGAGGAGTRYEAESAVLTNAVAKTLAGASAGAYVDGNQGAHLSWTITGGGGTQTIRFAASSPGGARSLRVAVNQGVIGALTTSAASFAWEVKSFTAYLHAGENHVDLWDLEGTAEPDVDYLEVLPTTPVTITASAGVGGKISPSGAVTVPQGGSQDFTFTPDPNMRVKRVCFPNATTCTAPSSNTWTLTGAAVGQTAKVEFEYVPGATCGDGVCNNRETVDSCSADCAVTAVSGRRGANFWSNCVFRGDSRAFFGDYLDCSEGATMGYQMTVPVGGWYRLTFSVTASSGTAKMGVFVNGVKVGVIQSRATSWNWDSVSLTAKLNNGFNDIELKDTEGAPEFDLEYYDWNNDVFGTRDGGFARGWAQENGSPIFTEVVEFERPSYLSPQAGGSWWIIDLFAFNSAARPKFIGAVGSGGLYVRDCATGEWVNADSTMFRAPNPISDSGGSTYDLNYFPTNTTVDSRTNPLLLDAQFACPGTTTPETAEITYQGGRRVVLATGFPQYAVVVKHR